MAVKDENKENMQTVTKTSQTSQQTILSNTQNDTQFRLNLPPPPEGEYWTREEGTKIVEETRRRVAAARHLLK